MAKKKIFTIGYQGRTLDDFLGELEKAGVKRVIDVRRITSSRKRDFSKTRFSQSLAEKGMEYVGMRELGTPDEVRRFYKTGGAKEEFLRRYEKYVDSVPEAMKKLESEAKEAPSAIMCYEKDAGECHRQILTRKLKKRGFEVEDL
jgi:uncharacterized protein (DUF488 family)